MNYNFKMKLESKLQKNWKYEGFRTPTCILQQSTYQNSCFVYQRNAWECSSFSTISSSNVTDIRLCNSVAHNLILTLQFEYQ